jgi:hypothetical protein
MPTTFTLIQPAVTVGAGGASSISFTSIPATYTDLVVKLSARSARATEIRDEIFIRFNSDSGANYSYRNVRGSGSAAISQSGSAVNQVNRNDIPASGATSSTFSNHEIYIPNYAGSTQKSFSMDSVMENNATESYMFLTAGLWTGTSAISTITLTCEVSTFVQFSTAYLYGVSNA